MIDIRLIVMTNVSRSLVLEVRSCDNYFFLEIHALSTYADMSWVMLHANHKYNMYMVVRAERFQEVEYIIFCMDLNEIVDKECSDSN